MIGTWWILNGGGAHPALASMGCAGAVVTP